MPSPIAMLAAGTSEMRGERLLQIIVFRIAVFPVRRCRLTHRLDDGGGRAEAAFVGADAGLDGAAALALDRFGPTKGMVEGRDWMRGVKRENADMLYLSLFRH